MSAEKFHQRMVDEHLDELAFLLHLRESLMPFSCGDFREWLELDRRIAAHIQGLLLRETLAWSRLRTLIARRPTKDRLRVAGVLALNASQGGAIRDYLRHLIEAPGKAPFADEVVRWVLPTSRARALSFLGDAAMLEEPARALWIELAALSGGAQGAWASMTGQVLSRCEAAPHTARALSRVSTPLVLPSLQMLLEHPDSGLRAGALCALMALGNPDAAPAVWALEATSTSFSTTLYLRAFLRSPAAVSELRLAQLWRAGFKEVSVLAIGALGRAALLPPLLNVMGDSSVARLAGRMFEVISGHSAVAASSAPTPIAGAPAGPKAYEHLVSPAPEAAAGWLRGPGRGLPEHVALIGGRVRTDTLCLEALRHGDCTFRYLFSEVLSVSHPALVDLDIRAPMYEQLRHPAMSTSDST